MTFQFTSLASGSGLMPASSRSMEKNIVAEAWRLGIPIVAPLSLETSVNLESLRTMRRRQPPWSPATNLTFWPCSTGFSQE